MSEPASGTDVEGAWRQARGEPALAEVFRTVKVRGEASWWRRLAAFFGPGYMVSVGYMDPGNWATSLAGGSKFGYALLFVVLISNFMAIVLQSLCARLAIATGRDLAQACRDTYSRPVSFVLWLSAEIAICATDLAEVIGTAIGLNLLFGLPLALGVLITAFDVLIVLYLQRMGFRYVEALIITLIGVVALCFAIKLALAHPDWGLVIRGFVPTAEIVRNPDMLYLALGIIGATVMPHNLYLHSGIIHTRDYGDTAPERREAVRFAAIDSGVALMFALLINAAILILAAASFNAAGRTNVEDLSQAHHLLAPLLGSGIAPTLFALALLACGFNSTITATLSGQIVMEGFINVRLAPWARRLLTRAIAIVPAAVATIWYGESGQAKLLILSQVVLSLQLPLAMIPLIHITRSRPKMGELVAPGWLTGLAVAVAALVIVLNIKLVADAVL